MTPPSRLKKILPRAIIILIFIAWTVFVLSTSPVELVKSIGVTNGYIVAFVLAFLGGFSLFVTTPYYLVVAALAAGGLNPVLVGLAAGIGIFLGDSTSYFIGYRGHDILPKYYQKVFDRFQRWAATHSSWHVALALFVYGAAIPLPNDVIVVPMGLVRYPYRQLMIPLGLGNVVFNIGVATVAAYGLDRII